MIYNYSIFILNHLINEAPTYATLTTRIANETSSNENISFNSASNNKNN